MDNASFPLFLHTVAWASLICAAACAVIISVHEVIKPQKMWIMNLVWPLTALFGGVIWLFAYLHWGSPTSRTKVESNVASLFIATSHCGAGCTVGDLVAELLCAWIPGVAVWFGWHSIFVEKTFAIWILDFILAFLLGIAFQYFTIKPMRKVSGRKGLVLALRADTCSITAWQVGMYGGMAAFQFAWFRPVYGGLAPVFSPEFWFAMQLSMLAGFSTSLPVNYLLLRAGWKEKM